MSTQPPPAEHARWCPRPEYEWQQPIWPTSSTRGRCITYNARTRQPWRCQTHGRHLWAECIHEKAAQARAREEWK